MKIKLVAQVVKVSDKHFTMSVAGVRDAGQVHYSVDDEYSGVVIRGECRRQADRQFMFGKGALGSLPTACRS